MKETWVTSSNEEIFQGEEYSSKEAAIIGGKEEWQKDYFYVGRRQEVDVSEWGWGLGERIKEMLEERAYNEVGEVAESWLYTSHGEFEQKVENLIIDLIASQFAPKFFKIVDVECIENQQVEP